MGYVFSGCKGRKKRAKGFGIYEGRFGIYEGQFGIYEGRFTIYEALDRLEVFPELQHSLFSIHHSSLRN
jgi:hypothetical protein